LTGLELVAKRGALMAQAKEGAMAAVLGFTADATKSLLQEHGFEDIEIANYNAPTQIVSLGRKKIWHVLSYFLRARSSAGADFTCQCGFSFSTNGRAAALRSFLDNYSLTNCRFR